MTQKQITKELHSVGADWALSQDKYVCSNKKCCKTTLRKAYHIVPNRADPRRASVIRFPSLIAIYQWCVQQHRRIHNVCKHK